MTYSCTDFFDSIMSQAEESGIIKPDDVPQEDDCIDECATLVCDGISTLKEQRDELAAALRSYQVLVAYLQRTTNPEEWATHGDWAKLQSEAEKALER